jgi:hypothetical protein
MLFHIQHKTAPDQSKAKNTQHRNNNVMMATFLNYWLIALCVRDVKRGDYAFKRHSADN